MLQKKMHILFVLAFAALFYAPQSFAQDQRPEIKNEVFKRSGLPLPRFASVAKNEANVRSGPDYHFPIKWVITRKGLPVEIILEYGPWRKIRDHEGEEGWVLKPLLSGRRTALIRGNEHITIYEDHSAESEAVAAFEPLVQVDVLSCEDAWCKISAAGFTGWVQRNLLWGVYEHENID